MKFRKSFTLIELLIVVGIIALLAGLITPAVITAQQKGRITQAKSDMHTILMALKGLEGTYGKMMNNTGSSGNPKFSFDGTDLEPVSMTSRGVNYQYVVLGPEKDLRGNAIKGGVAASSSTSMDEDNQKAYDAYIAELSDPKNKAFANSSDLNVNKRRQVFLDPKPDYNPSEDYDDSENANYLWLDPWGSRYVIYVNTNFSNGIIDPADTAGGATSKKVLPVPAAVVSLGPNGMWDRAKNAEATVPGVDMLPTQDDIASWRN